VTRLEQTLAHTGKGAIRTTVQLALQRLLEEHITRYLQRRQPSGIDNAVALLVNHRTMEVEAYAGSADFRNPAIQGQVDGIQARRSPGSVLKPFIYALALDQGLIHPMTLLKDAPRRFGAYTPENYDRGFLGPVFARDALMLSRNVPAVHLTSRLETPTLHEFLTAAGIERLQPAEHYGLALALGGHEVSMDEVVRLYAMLANRGQLRPLRLLAGAAPPQPGKRALSPEASFLTLDMLRGTPSPDEPRLPGQLRQDSTTAWKTGTSYGFRDAWTAGVFGPYVLAVWVGHFDGGANPAFVGRQAAAPLFFEIARSIEQRAGGFDEPRVPAGLNIATVEVCATTGDLPDKHCPHTTDSYFIPGISPLQVTTVYRKVPVNSMTGKRACYHDPPRTQLQVHEFWPSDLLAVFRTAGIARRLPPPFEADCALAVTSEAGNAPEITSPDNRIVYALRSGQREAERIPFNAITEADAKTLYWFVDNRFVGSTPRADALLWQPVVGSFAVRAVDDHGRAAATQLRVQLVN
jgi:penicillin-binding protein 1C